jgi:CRP/FNR family transcriptional regulator, anaerobic regulatory protein
VSGMRLTPTQQQEDDLCVVRVPLFQALTREQQHGVAEVATPVRVAKGEQVYAAGSDVSQLMVVHTGRLKISRISPDGREQIVRVLEPGDFVGESAFLTGERPDHFATAMEPGRMCVFRHRDLGRLISAHPSIGLRMLQQVSRRLAETETRLAAVTSVDVEARLARYLAELPASRAGGVATVRLPLPKKDIASLLDTTPESLSRQLGRLQESGVIAQEGSRAVRILDEARLVGLAGEG